LITDYNQSGSTGSTDVTDGVSVSRAPAAKREVVSHGAVASVEAGDEVLSVWASVAPVIPPTSTTLFLLPNPAHTSENTENIAAAAATVGGGEEASSSCSNHSIPHVITYSDKAIAVFGDTKPLKDSLKRLGGRFNMHLKHGPSGGSLPGWIFQAKSRGAVEQLITDYNQSGSTEGRSAGNEVGCITNPGALAQHGEKDGKRRRGARQAEPSHAKASAVMAFGECDGDDGGARTRGMKRKVANFVVDDEHDDESEEEEEELEEEEDEW
jgi:hypothetical protein